MSVEATLQSCCLDFTAFYFCYEREKSTPRVPISYVTTGNTRIVTGLCLLKLSRIYCCFLRATFLTVINDQLFGWFITLFFAACFSSAVVVPTRENLQRSLRKHLDLWGSLVRTQNNQRVALYTPWRVVHLHLQERTFFVHNENRRRNFLIFVGSSTQILIFCVCYC